MKAGVDYIGISAIFICHDGQGKILMHQRSEKCRDEQGNWEFGGGQLDFGEDVRECVLREVKEEYGCAGEIQEELPVRSLFREVGSVKTHWLLIPFIIKVDPREVEIGEPEKMSAIGWFTLDNLPSPLHSNIPDFLKEYSRYLKKYL